MKRAPLLTTAIVQALERLSGRLRGRRRAEADLARAIDLLGALPPETAPAVASEIAEWGGVQRIHGGFLDELLARFRLGPAHRARLRPLPGREWLYLFQANGYVREAALEQIDGPAPSAFFASALANRLNDWVPQVRQAAARAVARSFPATEARTLAPAALFLLDRGRHWQRWGEEEEVLREALARADLADALAGEICRRPQGPMARILVSAMRAPALDRHLSALAAGAVQPGVRATALEALIAGRSRWPVGIERKWVDKPMGVWRAVTVYSERAVPRPGPVEALIVQGLRDRSPAVRKTGLSGLITLGRTPPEMLPLVRPLAADGHRGVREKAAFLLAKEAASA